MRISCLVTLRSWMLGGTLLLAGSSPAWAVSCTTSPAMSPQSRAALEATANALGGDIVRDNITALRAASASFLTEDFASITSLVDGLKQKLAGATVTVDSLYGLNARDLTAAASDTQFFCGSSTTPLLVTISLGSLPPGDYALAIVHATGVKDPQQFALVLQNMAAANVPAQWVLAGYFVRPLTLTDHSGLWFWQQARTLKGEGAVLSSAMYYQAAVYLSRTADIYTSNNWDRLQQEASAVHAPGLTADDPLVLTGADGQSFTITGLSVDADLGVLDLRIDAKVAHLGDAVASRTSALELMSALLGKYPHLRQNFHGLWVYEKAADGQTYLLEQPMSALP